MSYIENVYICLAAPVLVAALTAHRRGRRLIAFILAGMTSCLLSSYISTFLAAVNGADALVASLTISPLVEEIMKFLPFLFYLAVFEPKKNEIADPVLMIAVGFATFENVCYLTQNGAASLSQLVIRGFATGAMHVVCGAIIAFAILLMWDSVWLRLVGTLGIMTVSVTYHGIYNILVSQTGVAAVFGCVIPLLTALVVLTLQNTVFRKKQE